MALNACTSCHMEHNASGPGAVAKTSHASNAWSGRHNPRLHHLSHAADRMCRRQHRTCTRSSAKIRHPFPAGTNGHDEAEAVVLNNNRHATCVDCHSPHASNPLATFTAPPAIRPPQAGVTGVSGLME